MGMTPPRRSTVRVRFTALYVGLFLLSGAALLGIAAAIASRASLVVSRAPGDPPLTPEQAQAQIDVLHRQLAGVRQTQTHQLLLGTSVALGVMALLSLLLGWLVAGRVLRPLRTMTAATRRISADNLHERLAVPGPADEVKDLADTIDELLARLEGAFAAQRRFVADASHELRTPLATMRASVDVAVAKPGPLPAQTVVLADRVRAELDQVDRLLDGFLLLARAQHGGLPRPDKLDLDALLSAGLAAREASLAGRRVTVRHATDGGPVLVGGDRTLLSRLVDNLLDNAVAHNEDGGWISVAAHADPERVRLTVENGGARLAPEEVARLAEPFRRVGQDRTGRRGLDGRGLGLGLGLAIVAAVAAAHGGRLELHARPEGGLRAVVTLEAAA
ncbi:signal transduction histidine kinase [Streptacidiphilus sp. MAP12-20]|uniref:HAMP domain-containing sensor histidine kinase n=1 Tax=Streptacidiphilus sp. MAP12-20 TaxID=3156299 RepID=UPI00351643E4